MRVLYLLQGPPACGKSTLARSVFPEDAILSYDTFRRFFGTVRTTLDGGVSLSVSQRDEAQSRVVKACLSAAETRMAVGDTLAIDNMNISASERKQWVKLAGKYGYDVVAVDVLGDLTDAELLDRNRGRQSKEVLDKVVTDNAAKARALRATDQGIPVISADQLYADLTGRAAAMRITDHFDKAMIVGDVHGHIDALNEVIEAGGGLDDPTTLWVFVGDLFDRGPESGKVFARLYPYIGRSNIRNVEGNHETNLLRVLNHTSTMRLPDTRASRDQILAEGFRQKEMKELLAATFPAVTFTAPDGVPTTVTHAGVVDPHTILARLTYGPVTEATLGSSYRDAVYQGKSSYSTDVDASLDRHTVTGHRQFHGHRAGEDMAVVTGKVYNLETGVTSGGHLTAASITPAGVEIIQVPVPSTGPATPETPAAGGDVAPVSPLGVRSRMEANPNVRVRDLGNGLVSCNFTREAFQDASWDAETIRARGLFLDGDRVAGRGYDKFFAVGERGGYVDSDLDHFTFPAYSARKVNGFLGIVFVHDGQLCVYTKAGPSDYATRAEKILRATCGDRIGALTALLRGTNTSALFEVIAADDPHIVDEGDVDQLWLLDVVRNRIDFCPADDVAEHLLRAVPTLRRAPRTVIDSTDQLRDALSEAADGADEGIVVRDADGRMIKVKAEGYAEVKRHRAAINRAANGDWTRLRNMNTPLARAVTSSGVLLADFTIDQLAGGRTVHLPRLVSALRDAGVYDD